MSPFTLLLNPVTRLLDDLSALLSLVVILAIIAAICAVGFVVLLIAYGAIGIIAAATMRNDREPTINPIGILGVAVVSFGVSLAATYFIAQLLAFLAYIFVGDINTASNTFLWIITIVFLAVQFAVLIAAGFFISLMSARFHVLHASVVAALYIGIWQFYGWAFPGEPINFPLWISYVDYASILGGALLGSIAFKSTIRDTKNPGQTEVF